jgi:hypothetical protein
VKKVLNNSVVPPGGGWTYINPEDGFVLTHCYYNALMNKVRAYRKTNNFPIGLQFEDQFDDNVCNQAAPNVCIEFAPPTAGEMAANLMNALFQTAKSGFKVVDQTEYQRRLSICEQCNFFAGLNGLLKVVCRQCGCSNKKLNLASSHCPLPGAESKW